MTRVVAVAALFSFVASTPAFAQCSDADRTALQAFDKSWSEATQRGDRAVLESYFADNYTAVNIAGTVDKATSIKNAVEAAERNRANPQPAAPGVADHYRISCTPVTATITHRNVFPGPAGSTAGPGYSRSVHFLEKRGGKWLAVSNVGHPINDQQRLVYMELDWNDAIKRHDGAWVEANYAPFATEISHRTGGIENRAQAVESAKTDKTVWDHLELSELTTRVEGDVGVVTGVNHLKGKDAQGKPFERRVRFTDTFIKRDGRWQVWATQGTTVQ